MRAEEIRRMNDNLRTYTTELCQFMPESLEEYTAYPLYMKRSVERELQLISDAEKDIMNMLYKERFNNDTVPSDYSTLLKSMRLPYELSSRMIDRKLFRDTLTHNFDPNLQEKFDGMVFDLARRTEDITRFVSIVENLIPAINISRYNGIENRLRTGAETSESDAKKSKIREF